MTFLFLLQANSLPSTLHLEDSFCISSATLLEILLSSLEFGITSFISNYHREGEMKITVLITNIKESPNIYSSSRSPSVQTLQGEKEDQRSREEVLKDRFNVFVHICSLPLFPSSIEIQVGGTPRQNPNVKDSDWVKYVLIFILFFQISFDFHLLMLSKT